MQVLLQWTMVLEMLFLTLYITKTMPLPPTPYGQEAQDVQHSITDVLQSNMDTTSLVKQGFNPAFRLKQAVCLSWFIQIQGRDFPYIGFDRWMLV